MQIKIFSYALLAIFLLSGCASDEKFKGGKANVKIYKLDLDNDNATEVVRVDSEINNGSQALITIMRLDKSEIASINIPGKLIKSEYPDLKGDGFKQIAVYYDDSENKANLVIYNLKNGKISTLSIFSSKCGIDATLDTNVARVKIGRPKPGRSDCPSEAMSEYDLWVWAGEKFIKER